MTVYLDIILLENLCMNYFILFATGFINKINMKHIRLLLSALLGGIYAISSYMEIFEIYSNFILKIILSVAMVYLAFKPNTIKKLFKELIIFYLTSFTFGGVAFALLYFVKPQDILMKNGVYIGSYPIKIAFLGAVVGFIVITIAFKAMKGKLNKKDMYCKVSIYFQKKSTTVTAMIDTGNLLKEPITGVPVIVVEDTALKGILPEEILENINSIVGGEQEKIIQQLENTEYISRFRVIPFSSLGKQNGLLLGFKTDYITITLDENEEKRDNIIVAIYDKPLTKNGYYSALVGLDILERRENQDESIRTIKV